MQLLGSRILLVFASILVGGCVFDADYGGGHYTCHDGKCPSGLTCSADLVCVAPGDAGAADAAVDARLSALTCADPGAAAGTSAGTTAGRSSTIAGVCGGSVMNGPDAVYELAATVGQHLMISISGSYPVAAYVIAPCTPSPATPSCEDDVYAVAGVPISVVVPATGPQFVVVDGQNAALTGTYSLSVTVQ